MTSIHFPARRIFLGRLAATFSASLPTTVLQAQTLQHMTLIVGFPPGGATDTMARMMADGLRAQLGITVVVENKPGAGARIAATFVKNAKPDGATLLFSNTSPMAIYPHLYRTLGYAPLTDFAPIGTTSLSILCLSVGPAVPESVKTLADYVAWVKANPQLATFGTISGSAPHFAGLLLSKTAELNLSLTPYKGGTAAVTDMLGGHIPATVTPTSEVQPFHAAGRCRILATFGARRSTSLPEVPTMAELGYTGMTFETWFGIFAPRGTPNAIVQQVNAAMARILQQDEVVASIVKLGMEPLVVAPERFGEILQRDLALYGESIQMSGFKAED